MPCPCGPNSAMSTPTARRCAPAAMRHGGRCTGNMRGAREMHMGRSTGQSARPHPRLDEPWWGGGLGCVPQSFSSNALPSADRESMRRLGSHIQIVSSRRPRTCTGWLAGQRCTHCHSEKTRTEVSTGGNGSLRRLQVSAHAGGPMYAVSCFRMYSPSSSPSRITTPTTLSDGPSAIHSIGRPATAGGRTSSLGSMYGAGGRDCEYRAAGPGPMPSSSINTSDLPTNVCPTLTLPSLGERHTGSSGSSGCNASTRVPAFTTSHGGESSEEPEKPTTTAPLSPPRRQSCAVPRRRSHSSQPSLNASRRPSAVDATGPLGCGRRGVAATLATTADGMVAGGTLFVTVVATASGTAAGASAASADASDASASGGTTIAFFRVSTGSGGFFAGSSEVAACMMTAPATTIVYLLSWSC
mmetsp:Transcript_3248/g.7065  ORF Transcript_3248/g.7065 Transcript_3248/m.7065 type:complete len:413 (+) Transcript_3248:540-1778(+)